ncbi:MAG: Zn-ribbon domain-containing OB-fold protein [Candidatus Thorarchaeota archaeon]
MSTQYDAQAPAPVPVNAFDNRGFWEGVQKRQLVFERCGDCGTWVHPPRPMCPRCHSLKMEWSPSTGRGSVYSWVTYRVSPHPALEAPYAVVLVELEEGVRLISNLVGVDPDRIEIGMPVEVVFDEIAEGQYLPRFRKRT